MGLRDIGATLPPGFRFYPSDEELICHYLYKKITNQHISKGTLVEIDLHTCEPWELPDVAKLNSTEWFFFNFRDRKYATGYRANRATKRGYWKATGKDRGVVDPESGSVVGMRKTLVFYKNRAPYGIKTGWIMHEFRVENPLLPPKEDWVLCRVFHKAKSEENSNNNNTQNVYNNTTTQNNNYFTSFSPHQQIYPCAQTSFSQNSLHDNNNNNQNPNPTVTDNNDYLLYNSPSNPSSLHASLDTINETFVDSKNVEDPYKFLFEMGLENGVTSNIIEDLKFDADTSNSLVFF